MIEALLPVQDISAQYPMIMGLALMSYILGSIPFGLVLGMVSGKGDIRKSGSGNIGATNMLRVGGKKLALITLILDGAKGAIAVLITRDFIPEMVALSALLAVMGHMFPIWLKFKGGKGVATTLACFLAISFTHGLILCAIWLVMAKLFKYSSLAALTAMLCAPIVMHVALKGEQVLPIILISTLVYIRHYKNITRLLTGEEPKIGSSKK
jgi:glycerol-3-phosphate acyltransferase PlsY